MLAHVHGCSIDEAYELLREFARETGRPISEVAHSVTTSPTSVPGLTTPRTDRD